MKHLNILQTALVCTVFVVLVGLNLAFSYESKDWEVPDKYKKMENPVKADKESLNIGKVLYSKHCKSCHGKYGEGDGSKASELDTPMEDFTGDVLENQTDGELFYKTLEGRDDMPGFSKKIREEEDIWHLVNYLRELAG